MSACPVLELAEAAGDIPVLPRVEAGSKGVIKGPSASRPVRMEWVGSSTLMNMPSTAPGLSVRNARTTWLRGWVRLA